MVGDGGPLDADYEVLFRDTYARLVVGLSLLADRAAAEDAVQDAFVQALGHWPQVRSYDDPAAWIRRVARNRLANHHRSSERRDRAIGRLAQNRPAGAPPESDALLDLRAALHGLPDRERSVVVLHHVVGVPVRELAVELELPEGTVKSILSRTRGRLRDALDDSEALPVDRPAAGTRRRPS